MIRIEHLAFAYGKTPVLRDVSLTAREGECVAVLGNNGAGKSTLITCLNRIRIPNAGQVLLDGKELLGLPRRELAQTVAYVPQQSELSRTTVYDCVLLGRKPYLKWGVGEEDLRLCDEMIERLELGALKLRELDELSGGERQKVMLARALVQQPKLLLLDEPTSNLDPKNQYEMLALVREIVRERQITALIVLHDLNLALRYCDRFFFLKDGRGDGCGDSDSVTPETILRVYGVRAEIIEHRGRKTVMID